MKVGSRFYSKSINNYGTVTRYCNDTFWWYTLDGEKQLIESKLAPKDLVWIETCYHCGKDCKDKLYQIKVINEIGKITFEKVCSKECAETVIQNLYNLHKSRADDIKHQSIQKFK